MNFGKDSSLGTSQLGRKSHCQRNLVCLQEVPEYKGAPGLDSSAYVRDEHFLKALQKAAGVKRVSELVPGRKMNRMHACNKREFFMCGIEQVIEELCYAKEAAN